MALLNVAARTWGGGEGVGTHERPPLPGYMLGTSAGPDFVLFGHSLNVKSLTMAKENGGESQ